MKPAGIGEQVRAARDRAGLSQRECASRADMSKVTLGRIETGKISPRLDQLESLSRVIGVGIQVLFGGEVSPPSPKHGLELLKEIREAAEPLDVACHGRYLIDFDNIKAFLVSETHDDLPHIVVHCGDDLMVGDVTMPCTDGVLLVGPKEHQAIVRLLEGKIRELTARRKKGLFRRT